MPSRVPFIHPVASLVGIVGAVFVMAWPQTVRADSPPSCDSEDSLITCAAADVGKPCQGGGFCYAMNCVGDTTSSTEMTLYKCYTCPTIVAYDGGCYPPGNACGDGGTCFDVPPWCVQSSKFACEVPAAAQPTGPPAGEAGSSSGGCGCALARGAPTSVEISGGLLGIGLVFLTISRRRHPR
jgi:MYXO-CTERM domain-containing protein